MFPEQEIALLLFLVPSLQLEDDRIMNFGHLIGLENFHIIVIELSSSYVKISIMTIYGILENGEHHAHSIN